MNLLGKCEQPETASLVGEEIGARVLRAEMFVLQMKHKSSRVTDDRRADAGC